MRIYNVNKANNSYIGNAKKKFIKPVLNNKNVTKTKELMGKMEKKAGFWATPIKYYVIALVIPIPLTSTLAFIYGIGVATYKKIKGENKKNLHKP